MRHDRSSRPASRLRLLPVLPLALVVLAAGGLGAEPAGAARVVTEGSALVLRGDPGERDAFNVGHTAYGTGQQIQLSTEAPAISLEAPCRLLADGTSVASAICQFQGTTEVRMEGGDEQDLIRIEPTSLPRSLRYVFDGGPDTDILQGPDEPLPVTLLGGADDDLVVGGEGPDAIDGGTGADQLLGDEGDDTIEARDGTSDQIDCGPGADVARVDSDDLVTNCEQVDRLPGPPHGPPPLPRAAAGDGGGHGDGGGEQPASRGCRVPRVRAGSTTSSARRALRRAGCEVRVRHVRSGLRRGRVVGLRPRAGTHARGAVTLLVSRGRRAVAGAAETRFEGRVFRDFRLTASGTVTASASFDEYGRRRIFCGDVEVLGLLGTSTQRYAFRLREPAGITLVRSRYDRPDVMSWTGAGRRRRNVGGSFTADADVERTAEIRRTRCAFDDPASRLWTYRRVAEEAPLGDCGGRRRSRAGLLLGVGSRSVELWLDDDRIWDCIPDRPGEDPPEELSYNQLTTIFPTIHDDTGRSSSGPESRALSFSRIWRLRRPVSVRMRKTQPCPPELGEKDVGACSTTIDATITLTPVAEP